MMTWRADFFDDTDDALPSRSAIISADSEDDAVDKAAAQMGDAVLVEFTCHGLGEIELSQTTNSRGYHRP